MTGEAKDVIYIKVNHDAMLKELEHICIGKELNK